MFKNPEITWHSYTNYTIIYIIPKKPVGMHNEYHLLLVILCPSCSLTFRWDISVPGPLNSHMLSRKFCGTTWKKSSKIIEDVIPWAPNSVCCSNELNEGFLGVPLMIHFNGTFPYKPFIFGVPPFMETSKSCQKSYESKSHGGSMPSMLPELWCYPKFRRMFLQYFMARPVRLQCAFFRRYYCWFILSFKNH